MKKALVLDTAALTRAFTLDSVCYTTPDVVAEVKDLLKKAIVRARRDSGELSVRRPDSSFLRQAERLATASGDLSVLSGADLSLLALALELGEEATLLTDDFALQNVALLRSIRVKRILGREIRDIVVWRRVCPVCQTRFNSRDRKTCPECGATLTRKAIRKRRLG